MDIDTTTRKVLFELIQYGIVNPVNSGLTMQYLQQVYSSGFNSGTKYNTKKKPVLQINKNGTVLCEYESLADAGRAMKINFRNIQRCIRGDRSTAAGYYWKFKNV